MLSLWLRGWLWWTISSLFHSRVMIQIRQNIFRRTIRGGRSSHVFRARSVVHRQTRLRRIRAQNSRRSPSRRLRQWSADFLRFVLINFNHNLLFKLLIKDFLIYNRNCSSLSCCLEKPATLSSRRTSTTSSRRKDAGRVSLQLSTHLCLIFVGDSSSVHPWSCTREPKVGIDKFLQQLLWCISWS